MAPKKIGRYEIRAELGRGGMATVYYAHDPRFDRDVAVKVLPREFLHDPTFRARFKREAKTIATLEHAAIVPVYDFGEEDGQPYLVMRFMPGGSLKERIAEGPLSVAEATKILQRIGAALDRAHEQGIIHRDLKPGNILFDQYGDAFLADFGIVKLTEASAAFTGSAIIGTPAYMSPEQARGETEIDGRSDIYALGTILFEMLTGTLPYQADTPMGLAVKHITEPVPRILDVKPDLLPGCDTVITRAMAKDRDERFATASEMTTTLAAVARGETVPVAPEAAVTLPKPKPQLAQAKAALPTERLKERASPLSQIRSLPGWVWATGGLALLLIAGGIIALSGLTNKAAKATLPPSMATAVLTATVTVTDTPTPAPTETSPPSNTPTATPAPSATPTWTATPDRTATAETACVYDVELVEVRDEYSYWYVSSQPTFDLVLHNNGTCPWPANTKLMLASKNTLDWQESWSVGFVDVGERKEIEIKLTAPSTPQTLNIAWQLEGPGGQSIGSQVTYDLRVESRPRPTSYGSDILLPPELAEESPAQTASSQAHLLSVVATTLPFIALAVVRFKAITQRAHILSRRFRSRQADSRLIIRSSK